MLCLPFGLDRNDHGGDDAQDQREQSDTAELGVSVVFGFEGAVERVIPENGGCVPPSTGRLLAIKKGPCGPFLRLSKDQSKGTMSSATMLMILIRGLMAGPAVSL